MQIKVTYSKYSTEIESAKLLFDEGSDIDFIEFSITEEDLGEGETEKRLSIVVDDSVAPLQEELDKEDANALIRLLRSINNQF